MKRKVKALVDGAERELEIELPDTLVDTADKAFSEAFIPVAVHNIQMGAARLEGKGPKKEDILKDDAFKAEALKSWGIDPAKLASGTDQEAVKKAVDLALQPVATERDTLKNQLTKLLDAQLDNELERFARESGVKDEFLARVDEKGQPVIVAMLRNRFAYNPETGYHAVKGPKDGEYAYSPKATADRPYLDVAGFFETWKGTDNAKLFLKDQRQRVGGPSPSGQAPKTPTPVGAQNGGPSKDAPMTISREEAASGAHLEGIANGTVVVAQS